jgi:hypothetical protein
MLSRSDDLGDRRPRVGKALARRIAPDPRATAHAGAETFRFTAGQTLEATLQDFNSTAGALVFNGGELG